MVEDELTDGTRIAQLLSSEVHGHERGPLGKLTVTDADTDVDPTEEGAFAFGIDHERADTRRIAAVYVHPDRAHVEFSAGVETVVERAKPEGLRVRPKAVEPPRTLVFVESGAEVKPTLRVIRAVSEALDDGA